MALSVRLGEQGVRNTNGSIRVRALLMASNSIQRSILGHVKHLLIVYHSKTGNTKQLADAAHAGACDDLVTGVEVRYVNARAAGPDDLLWANGLILATPENFGYMAGATKDFFDRTFYEVEGKLNPLPYALLVSAGNDGTGAVRSIERIVGGYPFKAVQEPIISRAEVTPEHLDAARELGLALALGLEAGIF